MRPRYVITLGLFLIVLAMGAWSFYGNVLSPHGSGRAMEGMVMPEDGVPNSLPPAAASGEADGNHDVLPASLAGIPLADIVGGDEARAMVEELHGKALGTGMDQAWVGHYGDAGQATVWVTRSANPADAAALMTRMTARIGEGNSPFRNSRPISISGVDGYELDGMGQKHFYFLVGGDLYWLAIAPDLAQAGLNELVANALAVATTG